MNSDHTMSDNIVGAALQSLQKSKEEEAAKKVVSGEDITSLNKLLQWSAANTTSSTENPSEGRQKAVTKTPEQLRTDKEWLDAAFPDMFAEVRKLIELIQDDSLGVDQTIDALEGLEEYFIDLNYAINIEKLGAVKPLLYHAESDEPEIRAAAVWVIGSSMRDLPEVKDIFMRKDVHRLLADRLQDDDATVRAKAVMASSALLRYSSKEIQDKFKEAGGTTTLKHLLSDKNVNVRRRARFFLQHAPTTGTAGFVHELLHDRNAIAALSESITDLDVDDVADVEAAIGAMDVLISTDPQGLLIVAPELPGVIDELRRRCSDGDLIEQLSRLSREIA